MEKDTKEVGRTTVITYKHLLLSLCFALLLIITMIAYQIHIEITDMKHYMDSIYIEMPLLCEETDHEHILPTQ